MVGCGVKRDETASLAFNEVYKKFDNFTYSDELSERLDSVFCSHSNLPFTDKFNYYNYKCGYYHICKHDNITANLYSDSLLLLTTMLKNDPQNDDTKKAAANLAKGDVLLALKKYSAAYRFYYQGKLAAEKSGNKETESEVNYRLGMALFRKGKYSEAATYFLEAFQQTEKKEPVSFSKFYRKQEVINNVVYSYVMANNPDSALLYSPMVSAYIDQNENKYPDKQFLITVAKAVAEGTTGQAYLLNGDTTEGEALLRESIAINSQPLYEHAFAIHTQLSLVHFYLDTTKNSIDTSKAAPLLLAIGKGLDTIPNEEYKAQWSYLMSRYYNETGNKTKAFSYLNQFIEYDKKVTADNKALSETDVSTYFKSMQNQYELELLKKNNDLDKTYLVISVILILLCGIIALLGWRYWQYSKEHVFTLTDLNKKIKNQKDELEQTLETLHKRSLEKDHILKVIAHDLRNPVTSINALTRLMKDDPAFDAEQAEWIDLINQASRESIDLIDTIMQADDSRNLQYTDLHLHDITDTIKGCVTQSRARAAEKNQLIKVEMPAKPQMALIDEDKIQRVIKNLLSNAIKFSQTGSIILLSIKEKEKHIIIKIKDAGIGIPLHLKHKVFDTFTEARRVGTNNEKTFGLGLSICKQFVEAHNGKIWFSSRENLGTAFYIKLNKQTTMQPAANYSKAVS